jgi:hypothetical protein
VVTTRRLGFSRLGCCEDVLKRRESGWGGGVKSDLEWVVGRVNGVKSGVKLGVAFNRLQEVVNGGGPG